MFVYRIAKSKFVRDLSGEGTRIYGSRWTPAGISVIFTSENRALAALEFYVHGKSSFPISSVSLATIEIPLDATIRKIDVTDLPLDWKYYPAPEELEGIGIEWIKSGELILRVPSVQVPHEFNYVLNAAHSDMKQVSIISVIDFNYDSRL
jgi:RES domain-containing protein